MLGLILGFNAGLFCVELMLCRFLEFPLFVSRVFEAGTIAGDVVALVTLGLGATVVGVLSSVPETGSMDGVALADTAGEKAVIRADVSVPRLLLSN